MTPLPSRLSHDVASGGYLESYALGVTLLAVAALAVALWVGAALLRRRRGGRLVTRVPRWAVNTGNGIGVIVLLVAGVGVMVNNYVGYVPTLGALVTPPGSAAGLRSLHTVATDARKSRVVRLSIPAPADGMADGQTFVYLPPGYEQPANAEHRYPVVYLFHGSPGRAADWFDAGRLRSTMDLLIREHYIRPMIAVSPTVSTGFFNDDECLNAPGHFALEKYLAFDVVDAIDRTFRTIRDRSHRAIGGMSSGGFCALNIGLHHLHRFSVILASEPYGDPGLNPLHRLLGGDWALWRANSPSFYLPLWRFSLPVASFLDSGGFDARTTTNALKLARLLAQRGQEASYRPAPHQHHNWREARMALPYALIFASQHFGRMPDGGSDYADAAQFLRVLDYARTLPPPRQPRERVSPEPTGSARNVSVCGAASVCSSRPPSSSPPPSARPTRPRSPAATPTPTTTRSSPR